MPGFKKLRENTKGRDFAVGDLHGAFDYLDRALDMVNFDPAADRVICVGDLIDRGPRSADCVDYLQQKWFFAVRGNHDDTFVTALDDNGQLRNGALPLERIGLAWIRQEDPETLIKVRSALSRLPYAMEVKTASTTVGFVHAEAPENYSWPAFADLMMKSRNPYGRGHALASFAMTDRKRVRNMFSDAVAGIDRVFSGHTPVPEARRIKNSIFIDTGAVFRMIGRPEWEKCHLTLADITAPDEAFDAPRQGNDPIRIITAHP